MIRYEVPVTVGPVTANRTVTFTFYVAEVDEPKAIHLFGVYHRKVATAIHLKPLQAFGTGMAHQNQTTKKLKIGKSWIQELKGTRRSEFMIKVQALEKDVDIAFSELHEYRDRNAILVVVDVEAAQEVRTLESEE